MSRLAYVNGRYLPQHEAFVHIEDRSYQFADAIYEYIAFYHRRLLDLGGHMARLERSLKEMKIDLPHAARSLPFVMRELIERSGREDGGLYLQVSRGVARRDHPFPKSTKPAVVMTICAAKLPKPHEVRDGVSVITRADERWKRCDIKSVGLLANVFAKQEASANGARETWLTLPDGTITEGAVSNAYIVLPGEGIVTHPKTSGILSGVTRDTALRLARDAGIAVSERAFNLHEIGAAEEAFITSTSANVLPVTRIDGKPVGSGRPGAITKQLMALYHAHVFSETGRQL